MTEQERASAIWNIKEIIRDDYDDTEVENVILPFTVFRRLDCELEYNYDTDELRYTISGRGGSSKTLTRDKEEELKKYLRNRQNIEYFFEKAYSTDVIRLGAHYRSHSMSMEYGSRKKSVSNGEAKSWEEPFIKICY